MVWPTRQTVRIGVDDGPRLVETVDEHARRQHWTPLVRTAADTEIAVGQRQRRLGSGGELGSPSRLDDPPLVRREQVLWRHRDRALNHSGSSLTEPVR